MSNYKATSVNLLVRLAGVFGIKIKPKPSFMATWTDAEILAKYPAATPLPITIKKTGVVHYACALCSMRQMPQAHEVEQLPTDPTEVLKHIQATHLQRLTG